MMIAMWQIDARFGHKQEVLEKLNFWADEIGPQAGMTRGRLLSGSIGAHEATIVHEWEVADLAEVDRAWAKLATLPAHAQWGKELEPLVVSGSSRWKVYRVIEAA
ncbi:MAG: hypothetical protein ACXU7D_07625 [Burkholderiaceae bacterium]